MSEAEQLIEQWLTYAARIAAQGHLEKAIADLLNVVESAPLNLKVREAIIAYAAQRKDYSMVVHQQMDCAEIHLMAGAPKAAVERYEIILAMSEQFPLASEAPPEAVTELRQLLALIRPEIHLRIGEARLEEGLIDNAMKHLLKAHEFKPGLCETHLALGRCHMAKLQYRQAIEEFQEILRISQVGPAHAQAYDLLGEIFLRQDRPSSETVAWWERAAAIYEQEQMYAEASRVFERILRLVPTHQKAYQSLGNLQAHVQPPQATSPAQGEPRHPLSVVDLRPSPEPVKIPSTTDF